MAKYPTCLDLQVGGHGQDTSLVVKVDPSIPGLRDQGICPGGTFVHDQAAGICLVVWVRPDICRGTRKDVCRCFRRLVVSQDGCLVSMLASVLLQPK